ncbi:FHA domain-containing protein [Kribbella sp. VKM Ac-2569]|nr:FHA domain-containing protein [Kribbella sp. VKM Ac-2569]
MLSLGEQQWTLQAGTDTITIGRASNADIRLQADDQISRIHARLNRDGDTWTLHDESRNGTGLNGRRITAPTPLTTGDRIHIGRSVLTFHKSTTTPPAPEVPHAEPDSQNEPNPIAPPNELPAASTPSAQPDQPPAASQLPQADPAPDPSPIAQDEQERAAASFAHSDQPVAASPFADGEQVPGGGGPFAPGEGAANPFVSAPPADRPDEPAAYDPESRQDADAGGYEAGAENGRSGAAGVVPGFEAGDGGTWASYPSADNPEPVRSPWEISAQIDQSEPNWNASAGWPDPTAAGVDQRTGGDPRAGERRSVGRDRRTAGTDRRPSTADQLPGADDRLPSSERLPGAERRTADGDDAVGTVRLSRVLIVAGAVIVLGIVVNLLVTFLADGPGSALRWLVPPVIALVVAMVLALVDAAVPKQHRPSRLTVSVLVAVAVVLVGVGVGGFALTAGAQYVGGYLTGNETGEDRLIKPVSKPGTGVTMTVENVTYTSHFTRVEVKLVNTAKQAITVPIDGTTFTAADGTTLRADPGRSAWPSRIAAGGTEHGTLTFKGHLPDSATTAVLTFKSGSTSFAISKIPLSN